MIDTFIDITSNPLTNHLTLPVEVPDILPCFSYHHSLSLPNNVCLDELILPKENDQFTQYIHWKWPNATFLFTDASKTAVGVGCAFLDTNNKYKELYKLPEYYCILSAELTAIYICLKYIKNNYHTPNKFIIFTDSKSALQKLKYPKFLKNNNHVIYEILNYINESAAKNIHVKLVWVKSHTGIVHNEHVDRLAKEAIRSGTILDSPLFITDIISKYKFSLKIIWNQEYTTANRSKGKHYALLHPKLPDKLWFNSSLNRGLITTISRLKFGHNLSKEHLFRINMTNSEICTCDNLTVEDANHLIFSCSKYDHNRATLLGELTSFDIALPSNITCTLYSNNLNVFQSLHSFITKNKIKL